MTTSSVTDEPVGMAPRVTRPELPTIEHRFHDAVDLKSRRIDSKPVAQSLTAESRAKRLADVGFAATFSLIGRQSYQLTPQMPYQSVPEAWIDAFDGTYSAGPAVDQIWWRLPPGFPTEFMAGCNFTLRQVPAGPSVLSLVFEAWPHQGTTGVVVIDIDAFRTEIEISEPVGRTVDIGFTHDGADPLTVMVFFRPGVFDFVFHSMSLGSTTMTGSISPWPVVTSTSIEHPVRTLQHLLRARGHNVVVDGVFGPSTEAAVKAFQTGRGLVADGVVGPITWPALIVQVKKGSQGDAVKGVQEEFQFRNLSGDPSLGPQIDGIFGPVTDASVRGFQQALSLDIPAVSVDGIVGPLTWRALVSGMLSFLAAVARYPQIADRSQLWRHVMAEPVLRLGSKDPAVRDLQAALKTLGFDPGSIDGNFGTRTESAVKAFQQAKEIPADGVVGRVTWINIDEADQTHPVLTIGSSGLPVRRLQSRMSAVGFDTGGVDGNFGAKTEAAVRKLQQNFNLGVDGVVGAQTWQVVDALENEGGAS